MNTRVEQIIKKVKLQYQNIDTILLFGSALLPDWTEQSDVDIFLIDDSLNDSRSETIIDGITVEFQQDSFDNIFKDIQSEYGKLLNRNVSTMIGTSRIISSKSSEKLTKLINSAKLTLSSIPVYSEQDVRMWKYSIEDYLSKAEKDITKNNSLAFYIHANYVLQNALEMSLALNGAYMPQPKYLGKLLEEKDPELFEIWNQYLEADSLRQKITILNRL
ncbi:nucleotidyltransferase domain-containing protein, partial [Candidatus Saccharibacteria bacterium]|nr:nucleotidyltransferase domain-containing protein [Candidatus Saccharibacteria bacterium]